MWMNALVIGCVIAIMMPTIPIFHQDSLEQRLKTFSRSLMLALPWLIAMAVTYMFDVRVKDPSRVLARGDQVDAAWFKSVSEAQEATSFMLLGAGAVFTMLVVQLLAVLVALRRFVVTQEIDLVARDQVALHQVTKPGDTEGIPVSGIGAPRPAEG